MDSDADSDADTDSDTDADIEVPEDNVANALGDCLSYYETPETYPNQLSAGEELQRYTLDDPEAVCNDGSRAVMYVRGATEEALADVWSIHLQGGGSCSSYLTCAIRWCGLGYHDSSKMSSENLPLNVDGFGIFDGTAPNLLQGANQVFFYYCSSDAWRGQGSAAYGPEDLEIPEEIAVELPGELPTYSVFRRGHTILASGLDELAGGLVADGGEVLPALSEASLIVLNGTSGGSQGARANADYVRDRLAFAEVVAIFDAALVPSSEYLPEPYKSALETNRELGWQQSVATDDTTPFMDETCLDHVGTTDEELCYDNDYVMMNHITTPFFARQDLRDMGGVESISLPEDDHEPAVVQMLDSLATIQSTAVERADITVVPGAYGPNCAQHVALESTNWWAIATVQDEEGVDWTFQDAVLAWYAGTPIAVIDEPNTGSGNGPSSNCTAVEEEH